MRLQIILFLITLYSTLKAQDTVYFTDGSKQTCTVTNIMAEHVALLEGGGSTSVVSKFMILLIEYHNGKFELFNRAEKDLETEVKDPDETENKPVNSSYAKQSYIALNTLALTNADLAGSYEYISKNNKFGFGALGSYNFNTRSTFQNSFIGNLSNGRKKIDLGVFCKAYLNASTEKDVKVAAGLLIKYTGFTFDIIKIDSVQGPQGNTQILNYNKANGAQLATLLTFDGRVQLTDYFFLNGVFGLGGFTLRGTYKEEFNKTMNKNLQPGEQEVRYTFLPKLYLALNAGFNF